MNSGVHIPQPCHEQWSTMAPSGNGRHCSSCNKVVVDFTQMSKEGIRNYLANDIKSEVCGHYKATQLDRPFGDWRDRLVSVYQKVRSEKNRIRILLLSFIILLSGCYRHVRGKVRVSSSSTNRHIHQKL